MSAVDTVYQSQRLRLSATVAAAVARAWAQSYGNRQAAVDQSIQIVTAGQQATVRLLEAYMAMKTLEQTGVRPVIMLDLSAYTIEALRGLSAAEVYGRPFGAYGKFLADGQPLSDAVQAALASIEKLAATDLQMAQTNAARDWMQQADAAATATATERIVGYRRVLTGAGPHCKLCTLASERTYRISDLMPIHEHCTCSVEPLWGTEPVASVGTNVIVEMDPEIGPRLMAESWSSVGPRLIP